MIRGGLIVSLCTKLQLTASIAEVPHIKKAAPTRIHKMINTYDIPPQSFFSFPSLLHELKPASTCFIIICQLTETDLCFGFFVFRVSFLLMRPGMEREQNKDDPYDKPDLIIYMNEYF